MKRSNWRKRAKWLLMLIAIVPSLSGCWDRMEIEDRANVLGISIDLESPQAQQEEAEISHLTGRFPPPTKSMVRLTAQIAVPGRIPLGPGEGGGGGGGGSGGSGGSGGQKPIWVVNVVGHTLDDAMVNLQQQLADRLFLNHLRVIIISEEFARKGVENVNEYLRRNPEVRRAAWMFVSKGKAVATMDISPPLGRVPSLYLMSTLDHAVSLGKFPNDFLGIFWSASSSLGQEPYLPYISVKGKDNIQISGMAYFKGNKMVGVTKPLEIGFYMAVKGMNPAGYIAAVPVQGQKATVMVRASHRQSKVDVTLKNGRPHANIKINIEGELDEKSNMQVNLGNPEAIRQIEHTAEELSKKTVESLIKDTQQHKADIFGFGEYLRAKHAKYWDTEVKTKEKWAEIYKDMSFEVSFSIRIRRVGMTAR